MLSLGDEIHLQHHVDPPFSVLPGYINQFPSTNHQRWSRNSDNQLESTLRIIQTNRRNLPLNYHSGLNFYTFTAFLIYRLISCSELKCLWKASLQMLICTHTPGSDLHKCKYGFTYTPSKMRRLRERRERDS